MLSVESVLNVVSHVNLVNYLVSVLLQCCCENNYFVVLGHGLNEFNAARTHEEEAVIAMLNIMNELMSVNVGKIILEMVRLALDTMPLITSLLLRPI